MVVIELWVNGRCSITCWFISVGMLCELRCVGLVGLAVAELLFAEHIAACDAVLGGVCG